MNPQEVTAWVQVAAVLASIGVDIRSKLKGLIHHAQPDLTPKQQKAAFDAILADDAVRSAIAAQAAGETPPSA